MPGNRVGSHFPTHVMNETPGNVIGAEGNGGITPSPAAPPASPPRERRWAIIACILALSIFIASIVVLYLQWFHYENPNGLIVVEGDASLDDAEIVVSQLGRAPLRAQLKSGTDHRLRFHVPPGHYSVAVQVNGRPVMRPGDLYVEPRTPMYVSLARQSGQGR
jgi:hypothetical protein